jgi:hypothetical protein
MHRDYLVMNNPLEGIRYIKLYQSVRGLILNAARVFCRLLIADWEN